MVKNTKIWENPIDHSMSRGQVCLMWLRKASGTIQNNKRLTPTIKSYFIECYSIEDRHHDFDLVPFVEENSLRSTLATLLEHSLVWNTELRSWWWGAIDCYCRICHVPKAHFNKTSYTLHSPLSFNKSFLQWTSGGSNQPGGWSQSDGLLQRDTISCLINKLHW